LHRFIFALATEFLGLSVTGPEQITEATGLPVFEIIPIIETSADRRKRRRVLVMAFGVLISAAVSVAALIYRYRV
jgi:hypothetical protein